MNQTITLGDKIDLYKISNGREVNAQIKTYKSQIIDFVMDDTIKILMPFDGTKIVPLEIDDKYNMCFYTNNGLFNCIGEIKNRYRLENLFILEVQLITKLQKYQRREYFRLNCFIHVDLRIISKEEQLLQDNLINGIFENTEEKEQCKKRVNEISNIWVNGVITNISGGGAKICSEIEISKEEKLVIKLPLLRISGEKVCELDTNVISSQKLLDRNGMYETRVEYLNVKKDDREAIIKFVFEEERRLRRIEKGFD